MCLPPVIPAACVKISKPMYKYITSQGLWHPFQIIRWMGNTLLDPQQQHRSSCTPCIYRSPPPQATNCNPVISYDSKTGSFTASPAHLGFRLHVNMSYSVLASVPGQIEAFISSTREALAIVFINDVPAGAVSISQQTTGVYIRSAYASAWPSPDNGESLNGCRDPPALASVPSECYYPNPRGSLFFPCTNQ